MCDNHFSISTKFKERNKKLKCEILFSFVKPISLIFTSDDEHLNIINVYSTLFKKTI